MKVKKFEGWEKEPLRAPLEVGSVSRNLFYAGYPRGDESSRVIFTKPDKSDSDSLTNKKAPSLFQIRDLNE
ncbi:MAG: hypothetical protein AABZ00_01640 [Chloroflexota bacterium]